MCYTFSQWGGLPPPVPVPRKEGPMPYYTRNIIVLSIAIFLAAFSWNQVVPFLPLFLKQLGVGENVVPWSYGIFVC